MSKQNVAIGLLGVAVILTFAFFQTGKNEPKVGAAQAFSSCYLGGNEASTTLTTLIVANASTTLDCYVERADRIDLSLYVTSTGTPTLLWDVAFSHNGTSWFYEDVNTIIDDGQVLHRPATSTVSHWSPASKGQSLNVNIDPVAAKYMRISFDAVGADAQIWAGVIMREQVR